MADNIRQVFINYSLTVDENKNTVGAMLVSHTYMHGSVSNE